jgi:hypothetical protein
MIFECVGAKRCINGKRLFLIYEKPQDRKFAPQWHLTETQLEQQVNTAFASGKDITIYYGDYQ